ncbi:MAG: chemotaxis protein CheX [Magnetococcales bacterium]|nr:chemotaxis protein CheX [Magnetococcales bacterium]
MKEDLFSPAAMSAFAAMIKDSVSEVFGTYLTWDISPGPMVVKREGDPYRPPETEVTSIVNFSGGIYGGVHLASSLPLALQMATNFSGDAYDTIFGEAGDALGELANMIGGGVQTRLSKEYGTIHLTPPTIISGTNYRMQYKSNFGSVRQYFKVAGGLFYVEFFFWPG